MIQLITPLWGPLSTQQAAQVILQWKLTRYNNMYAYPLPQHPHSMFAAALQALSDSNTDFLVVGVCSSETQLTQQLVSLLSGKAAAAAAPGSAAAADIIQQQLPGLQMHVSHPVTDNALSPRGSGTAVAQCYQN